MIFFFSKNKETCDKIPFSNLFIYNNEKFHKQQIL
jgi:hypothetical protein